MNGKPIKIGRLTLLSRPLRVPNSSRTWVECECDCGNLTFVRVDHLRSGNTRSCGCLGLETRRANRLAAVKHGDCRGRKVSPEWKAWSAMRDRCLNPNCREFKYYGARGIRISKKFDSFEGFLSEVGRRPSALHSIDRKNNNKGYFPGNLRWATKSQQMINRRPWKTSKTKV